MFLQWNGYLLIVYCSLCIDTMFFFFTMQNKRQSLKITTEENLKMKSRK